MTQEQSLSALDKRLNQYKKDKVNIDPKEMETNRRIADTFVKKFIKYLKDECSLEYVKCEEQGSAFENVKVFNPNQLDYLVYLSADLDNEPKDKIIEQELANLFKSSPKKYLQKDMTAYRSIQIPELVEKHKEDKKFWEGWPGTNQECVSSQVMNSWYKTALYKFWEKNKSDLNIEGVKRIDLPRHHEPELIIKFVKEDGKQEETVISVHMTACIRLYSPDEDQYFIPKMLHPEADEVLGQRDSLLWLQTNSKKEKDAILSKFEHQRDNYRIVKALMYQHELIADDGTESYIIKAIFLRDAFEELLPSEKPTDYLTYFLEALHGAYDLEQKRRGGYTPKDEEKKKDTIQGYTNPQENVLARYRTLEIKSKLGDLNELLKLGEKARVDKLMLKKN